MVIRCLLTLLLLVSATTIHAVQPFKQQTADDPTVSLNSYSDANEHQEFVAKVQREAVEYQQARYENRNQPESYQQEAATELEQIRRLLIDGRIGAMRERAQAALQAYAYSRCAPRIRHQLLRSYLVVGAMDEARWELARIWFYYQDHGGSPLEVDSLPTAFKEALIVAEQIQGAENWINFAAENPEQVFTAPAQLSGKTPREGPLRWIPPTNQAKPEGKSPLEPERLSSTSDEPARPAVADGTYRFSNRPDMPDYSDDPIFRFLAVYGDKSETLPRAKLGLARTRLFQAVGSLSIDRDALNDSRQAYQELLEEYPHHELTFTAMVELALSYLVVYQGELYDGGTLIEAEHWIRSARIVCGNQPERQRIVKRLEDYRRFSQQRHDLTLARWYHDFGFWRDRERMDHAAKIYYQLAIQIDPDSNAAQIARQELAELEESAK